MLFAVDGVQAAIYEAKSEADRARREFDRHRHAERQDIEERLGKAIAERQRELATAKAKAATDVSRIQVGVGYRKTYDSIISRDLYQSDERQIFNGSFEDQRRVRYLKDSKAQKSVKALIVTMG